MGSCGRYWMSMDRFWWGTVVPKSMIKLKHLHKGPHCTPLCILRFMTRETKSNKGMSIFHPPPPTAAQDWFWSVCWGMLSSSGPWKEQRYSTLSFTTLHQVLLPSSCPCHPYLLSHCASLTNLHRVACWRPASSRWFRLFMPLWWLHMFYCALFYDLKLNMGSGDLYPQGMNRKFSNEAEAYQLGNLDLGPL